MFVNHEKNGRSGHLSHALVEYRKGCVMAFYSNCSGTRDSWAPGHNGFGWLEYRRSVDGGRTWDEPTVLPVPSSLRSLRRRKCVLEVNQVTASRLPPRLTMPACGHPSACC